MLKLKNRLYPRLISHSGVELPVPDMNSYKMATLKSTYATIFFVLDLVVRPSVAEF
jgi:hypothetical protein